MAASPNFKLKLLVDKKAMKVVFAEASKDAVDFLYNILTLPLATIIRLLSDQEMVGCINNLCQSIEKLDNTYIKTNQHKDTVLKNMMHSSADTPKKNFSKEFYKCDKCVSSYVTYKQGSTCSICGDGIMNIGMRFLAGENIAEEVATGRVVTYMVMDDLVVVPMSPITGITLFSKFNVIDVGAM